MSREYINVLVNEGSVDTHVYIAVRPCTVAAVRAISSTAGGSGAEVVVRKCVSTEAPASGLALTGALDLTGTNAVQSATLVPADGLVLAAGNRLAIDMGGTLTSLVGVVTIEIETGEIR